MSASRGGSGRPSSTWTAEDISRLEELWGTARDADVAEALGKSISTVRFKAGQLNLREKKGRRAGCRPGRVTYPWSAEEDLVLKKNVGYMSIFELQDALPRRNRVAIERRCYELGFSPTQGTYTRARIEKDTGYDWRQIRRAKESLGQVWKRYGERKYMISFDQVQEITEWLRDEKRKWSREYNLDNCTACGADGEGDTERHSGDGLCKQCWDDRRHKRARVYRSFRDGHYIALTVEAWLEHACDDSMEDAEVAALIEKCELQVTA